MNVMHQVVRMLLAAFALLCMCSAALAGPDAGMGYVDDAHYFPESRQLVVSGWAAPEKPGVFTTNLIVTLGEQEIYRGRMERSLRPDVVASTGRGEWLSSGFSIRIAVSGVEAGPRPLKARMHLGDGTEFDLGISPTARIINVPPAESPSILARLMLLLALSSPLFALVYLPRFRRTLSRRDGSPSVEVLFCATVMLSFFLLVAAGWTGSSLRLLVDERGIASYDGIPWLGEPRAVRSDEWLVITPMAISQAIHQPKFPLVNRSLGPDGQNMLVVGMAGVPVAHISSFAKPATWGFFLFDMRRALAWYWWFPFFSCFGAIWLMLRRFFALDWRLAAGMALTIAVAPYSAVYSGWPAYVVFFPVAGLLAADALMRTLRWQRTLVAGVLLGLAISGFALVLYPAWQIPLAYLFVPFALAWFGSRRREFNFRFAQAAGLFVALALALLLLISWWLDASDAITSIRGTVYPGQRSVEVGGDIDGWFLVKGLMSPITMYHASSLMWGASDAGSVAFFILPAMAAVVLRFIHLRRVDAVAMVLCGYIAFTLCFMFRGFWPAVASWTLWGSTTSYRLDLTLGVAQLLVFAWLARPIKVGETEPATGHSLAFVISALAATHAAFLYRMVPPAVLETVPPSFVVLSLMAVGAGGYLLLRGRHAAFFCVYGALMFAAAFPFNPLGVAPDAIQSSQEFAKAIRASQRKDAQSGRGIVVIGQQNWSMLLPAIGFPVVNGVSYYPQPSLWKRLDPQGKSRMLYNRYQRLFFVLGPQDAGQGFRIESPRLDEVRVTLDPARFDFRLTGGEAVLAPASDAQALSRNGTLKPSHVAADWALFSVLP
ncbi:MAG: hypothetical protein ABI409_00880 [Ramlibacter sp.]